MPASINPSVRNQRHSTGFIVGQHSLFLAAMGQSFFYLHQFKPHRPVWVAVPFFMIPWGTVFVLFYHARPLFPAQFIRRWWFGLACCSGIFTVVAEAIWLLGYVPPSISEHRFAADVLVQALMNLGWLSFIPMIRDYNNNPSLWT